MTTRRRSSSENRSRREIDYGDDDSSVAAQVSAIEAVVAQLKQMDAAMAREKNRVEKLENEVADLKRELERHRQERRGNTGKALISMAAEAFLPDGIVTKVRAAWNLLEFILGD